MLLAADLKLAADQIKDGRVLEVKTGTKAEVAAARKRVVARTGALKSDEQLVVAAMVAATKTFYTVKEEDAEYSRETVGDVLTGAGPVVPTGDQWARWLAGLDLGRDGLGQENNPSRVTIARGGPASGTTERADHAHHIVMKKGDKGASIDAFLARSILWAANAEASAAGRLNPFMGLWNFAWAPNWSHSAKYAEDVLNRLKAVKDKGPTKVHETLVKIAQLQIQGHWYVGGGGKGD